MCHRRMNNHLTNKIGEQADCDLKIEEYNDHKFGNSSRIISFNKEATFYWY